MDNAEIATLLTHYGLKTAEVAGTDGGAILAVNAGGECSGCLVGYRANRKSLAGRRYLKLCQRKN